MEHIGAEMRYNYPHMKRQLHLYWFSGSGNTLQAASAFAQRLRQREWSVELRPLERSDPQAIDPEAVLGLAFPTYFFSIPEIVRTFVRSLPKVEGTSAMMIGTHGALSGGVVGPMRRELTVKGFRCIAARILLMPDSFFPILSNKIHHWQLKRGLNRAERYADDFAAGTVRWTRWAVLSDIHGATVGGMFAARRWTRNYYSTIHARREQCTRCDTCVRCCPVNALERIADSPPRPQRNCTNCLRCVAVCPADAMRHLIGFRPYRSEDAKSLKCRLVENLERIQN
jgi:ferredoxin